MLEDKRGTPRWHSEVARAVRNPCRYDVRKDCQQAKYLTSNRSHPLQQTAHRVFVETTSARVSEDGPGVLRAQAGGR